MVQFLLFGGEFPADLIIPRLYILHVLLIPVLIAALLGVHLAVIIRQKHAQFPGPGRNDHNVVGSKLWPTYGIRSLALLCAVLAVVFGFGGFAQINPVWVWGPYEPAAVTAPAQPDWYLGWVDGMLRIFPAVELRVFGYLVPSPFLPGVFFPTVVILLMYVWPWVDRRLTGDRDRHQVLDRPRVSRRPISARMAPASFDGDSAADSPWQSGQRSIAATSMTRSPRAGSLRPARHTAAQASATRTISPATASRRLTGRSTM
ncbi:hypothetical protein GCM10027187_04950 [Streptosporangium sandarakinum]|uniref:Cytochrome bc1 complex cytochrome b subunit n=1 Tax=Streptosporangium sandarakinum TaxID=1260955 RepID=A0A852UWU3_9ACTN|nr:cytochrome b N-terminal domain-containing protein [Streptosporangium sandarakinum]NYF40709.1 quinol-cytochrome oxidoreductase complex cytochrome b subunit [Streptosporangium sandarakinum]